MSAVDWTSPPVVTTPCPQWCDGTHEERVNVGEPGSPPSGDAVHRSAAAWIGDVEVFVTAHPEDGAAVTLLRVGDEAMDPSEARRFALAILAAADMAG